MTFDDGVELDPGRAGGGGGGRRGVAVGGGVGGLVLVLVAVFLGVDPSSLGLGDGTGGAPATRGSSDFSRCTTGAAADADVRCRIIATAESLDAVWADVLPAGGGPACTQPGLQIFSDVLVRDHGSAGGPLAQEYVVAHEFGHHVTDQLGLLRRAQQDPSGAASGSVRAELQADCVAGVWAAHATTEPDPESFTHGRSAQRQRWFTTGYRGGSVSSCGTFGAATL